MLKKFPQTKFLCVGALVWASHVHILALAWASRGHVLALAWASWCLGVGKLHALVPWCGQAARVGALAWAHWCLGVASGGQVLPLAWASHVQILDLAVKRLPPKKKKKKVARNFLKFCMEVYNLILSTSGKD